MKSQRWQQLRQLWCLQQGMPVWKVKMEPVLCPVVNWVHFLSWSIFFMMLGCRSEDTSYYLFKWTSDLQGRKVSSYPGAFGFGGLWLVMSGLQSVWAHFSRGSQKNIFILAIFLCECHYLVQELLSIVNIFKVTWIIWGNQSHIPFSYHFVLD